MTDLSASGLRAFVDHLAARGVQRLSVRQGAERLDLTLASGPAPEVRPFTAPGPGILHHAHPTDPGAGACLQSGHFLFPLALSAQPSFLAAGSSTVGYGTPLATCGDSA